MLTTNLIPKGTLAKPLILVDDFSAHGALMPVIAAIVFTWVFQNSSGSVLLAILMHVSHRNSVRYLGRVYSDADYVQQQWIAVAIWVLAVAAILVAYGSRGFVARRRHTNPTPAV